MTRVESWRDLTGSTGKAAVCRRWDWSPCIVRSLLQEREVLGVCRRQSLPYVIQISCRAESLSRLRECNFA